MRKSVKFWAGLAGTLLAAGAVQARTGILIPIIPFPGATTTSVFGIADDNNTIAGSYVDSSGVTHGFYGTLDGNYTSFDFGTSGFTQARAIDGKGKLITGFSNNDGIHCDFQAWEKIRSKDAKAVTKGGTPLAGIEQGLNSSGEFAGDYCDLSGSGTVFGMLGENKKWVEDVDSGFTSTYTGERGVNTQGTFAGFYVDPGSNEQVGTLIEGGTTTTVVFPDPTQVYTVLEGINDDGIATGQWLDSGGIVHSFSYDPVRTRFVEIDDPLAGSFTQAWGINRKGLIAVTSNAGAYIYCDLKPAKCPTTGTAARTIVVRETTLSPGALRGYVEAARKNQHNGVKLPKGAALQ